MWFDELMDSCKRALALITANIWIVLPYVLHTLALVITFAALALVVFLLILGAAGLSAYFQDWLLMIPAALVTAVIVVLVVSAVNACIEAGSVRLFAAVAAGERPSAPIFWAGVRSHFMSMWGLMLLLSLAAIVLSPVLIVVLALIVMVGGLSAGWGFLIFPVMLTVYLGAWTVALVLDNLGGLQALKAGVSFVNRYFWGLVILGLAATLLGPTLSGVMGPLVAMLAGWIIAAFVRSWSTMAIILIYQRRRPELQG